MSAGASVIFHPEGVLRADVVKCTGIIEDGFLLYVHHTRPVVITKSLKKLIPHISSYLLLKNGYHVLFQSLNLVSCF